MVNYTQNKKISAEQQKYKDELENIVEDIENILGDDITNLPSMELNKRMTFMNFEKVKEESDAAAFETVDSIVEFYLDSRMYDGPEGHRFLKNKMNMDKMTVSNLIFQMKTAEHAITKLLEDIDNGNMHPRQFEVLSALQKSKMDIIKHLSFVIIQMENNYKIIRQEYENLFNMSDNKSDDNLVGGIGTKNLLQEMQTRLLDKEMMNLDSN